MAHAIEVRDRMFSVREPAWHNLGVVLPELATAREAIEAANLGWEVKKAQAWFEDPTQDDMFVPVPRTYHTLRMPLPGETDRNGSPVLHPFALGTVGEDYTPLQNLEAFKFMDEICQDPGGPKYVTAGSLHNGRKVWMLVKMPSFIEVSAKDQVAEYLLLSNTHDGSRRVEILWTPVRVVCQNTLSMALSGSRKNSRVRFKHTANLTDKIEKAQDILGIVRQNHDIFIQAIDAMKSYEPTNEEIDESLKKLFPASNGREEATHQSTRTHDTIRQLFHDGEANTEAGDTTSLWAFYNGITEFVDHVRTSTTRVKDAESRRVDSNWFGAGAELKIRSFEELMGLVPTAA